MLAQTLRPIGAALDPDRIRRAAGDIQPPDTAQLVRSLHAVPDRLDDMIDDAGQAIRDAVQQLPDRLPDQLADRLPITRRRRGPGKGQLALMLGGLFAIGLAGWLAFRLRAQAIARAEEARLEQADLDRAADEGMTEIAPLGGEGVRPVPVPMDRTDDEPGDEPGAMPADHAYDDLLVRPTVGMGLSPDR